MSSVEETTVAVTVASKRMDGDSVAVLTLRAVDGGPLPPWTPGSHIDVVLTPKLTRQYSLCGDPNDPYVWQIGVLREPEPRGRGGSAYIHDSLEVGAEIQVRGPRNHFPLKEAAEYLLIAGGIGITPIKAMIDQLEASGAKWRLFYGGRTLSTMALRAELAQHGDRVNYVPEDTAGFIDLDGLLGAPVEGALVYCCGPGPLLDAVEGRCGAWPSGSLQIERFTPQASDRATHGEPFEVELAQSSMTLTVPPHKSILEVLEDNGISMLSSCRSGVCGTCETDVLEGTPEHRDAVLTPEEREANETMMVCVSRCAGKRLVLDL